MPHGFHSSLLAGLSLRSPKCVIPWLLGALLCIGTSASHQPAAYDRHASAPGQLLPVPSSILKLVPLPLPELGPAVGFASIAGTKAVRWNGSSKPIRVRVEDAPGVDGWSAADARIVEGAFRAWEGEGAPIQFVLDTANDADVVVHWVDHLNGPMSGWTTVTWDSRGEIHHGDVRLALKTQDGRRLTPAERLLLATHEFGHVLGLGHSQDRSAIMSAVIYARDIGQQDMTSVQRLYGSLTK